MHTTDGCTGQKQYHASTHTTLGGGIKMWLVKFVIDFCICCAACSYLSYLTVKIHGNGISLRQSCIGYMASFLACVHISANRSTIFSTGNAVKSVLWACWFVIIMYVLWLLRLLEYEKYYCSVSSCVFSCN